MKQTVVLGGDRKAIVQIPYSRLVGAQRQQPTSQKQDSPCCEQRIILKGACNSRGGSNSQVKKMIQQLQYAYDNDVKQLQAKIKELQTKNETRFSQTDGMISKIKIQKDVIVEQYQRTIKLLKIDIEGKDDKIAKLIQEKDVIVRNKISQFRQSQYLIKIQEKDHIIRLREADNIDLMAKLKEVQFQNKKIQEKYLTSKILWEEEISKLAVERSQIIRKYNNQIDDTTLASKIKLEENQRTISQVKYKLGKFEKLIQEKQTQLLQKERKINNLTLTLRNIQEQLSDKKNQIQNLKGNKNLLISEITNLKDQLSTKQKLIINLQNEKSKLQLQTEQRLILINSLKQQLQGRQKVYEVKIQRVIDGKERINQLQLVVQELQMQLKQLSQQKQILAEEVKKRQNIIQQMNAKIFEMRTQITTLKAYIEKREGSFKWVVERQIEKDISISQIKPQGYKVSQVRQFTRQNTSAGNRIIAQNLATAMQQQLFRNNQQTIIMTGNYQAN